MKRSILFVCLGNICRSPIAEGVFAHELKARGVADAFTIDSAGTGGWHAGELPDSRARAAARRAGVTLDHRARQVTAADYARFDLLLAMDRDNKRKLRALGPAHGYKIRLLSTFSTDEAERGREVPDPYYGDDADFDHVVAMCQRAARGLAIELLTPSTVEER